MSIKRRPNFKTALRYLRHKHCDGSNSKLANSLGCTRQYISSLMKTGKIGTLDLALKLCNAFGIDLVSLFEYVDSTHTDLSNIKASKNRNVSKEKISRYFYIENAKLEREGRSVSEELIKLGVNQSNTYYLIDHPSFSSIAIYSKLYGKKMSSIVKEISEL